MKTLLIAVFVSVFISVSPVKAELLRLDRYGNCTIYEKIDEFTDELKDYRFICRNNRVFMSLAFSKKERNSRKWSLIFNDSSHIKHFAETKHVAGKVRIGKQPTVEFNEARTYTGTSLWMGKAKDCKQDYREFTRSEPRRMITPFTSHNKPPVYDFTLPREYT